MTDDERAIREWMAATKAGDVATVLGLMSDDVVFMVPGREPFGKRQFAATSQGMAGVRLEVGMRRIACPEYLVDQVVEGTAEIGAYGFRGAEVA